MNTMDVQRIQFGFKDVVYIVTIVVSVALSWASMNHQNALAIEEIKTTMAPRSEYQQIMTILSDIQQRVSRIEGQLTK